MLMGVDATGETICQPMCVDSQSQSLECDDFGTSADQSVRHLTVGGIHNPMCRQVMKLVVTLQMCVIFMEL